MDRFANVIIGHLCGHTHADSWQIIRSSHINEVAGVAIEHPSLSPNTQMHPSYRIYTMDSESHALLDYEQYRMNLTEANRDDNPKWKLYYRFREYYNVPNMFDYTYKFLAEHIKVNDEYYKKFALMIYAQGSRSIALANDIKQKERIYCKLVSGSLDQWGECSGGLPFSISIDWAFVFLTKYFVPPWEYAFN